jgi:hypothetical protein
MNIKIGFADAVREAVSRGNDDWLHSGWVVIRRTEPYKPRGDRATAMIHAQDHVTPDIKEYWNLARMMKRVDEQARIEAERFAKELRIKQFSGICA